MKYLLCLYLFLFTLTNCSVSGNLTPNSHQTMNPTPQDRIAKSPHNYEVNGSGNKSGLVTVKDKTSGKVIRTFQMKKAVVREVFLLDGGEIVAASQKDHTIFWNLETGKEVHRIEQRIYGFTHNQTKFLTHKSRELVIYSYPNFQYSCQLTDLPTIGPDEFSFSPNDQFLGIVFATGRPESDKDYPHRVSFRSVVVGKLFDITKCQEVKEFSELQIDELGKFSHNSKFYDLEKPIGLDEPNYVQGLWRFDLTTRKLTALQDWN
jgi:WD40 repeat protein